MTKKTAKTRIQRLLESLRSRSKTFNLLWNLNHLTRKEKSLIKRSTQPILYKLRDSKISENLRFAWTEVASRAELTPSVRVLHRKRRVFIQPEHLMVNWHKGTKATRVNKTKRNQLQIRMHLMIFVSILNLYKTGLPHRSLSTLQPSKAKDRAQNHFDHKNHLIIKVLRGPHEPSEPRRRRRTTKWAMANLRLFHSGLLRDRGMMRSNEKLRSSCSKGRSIGSRWSLSMSVVTDLRSRLESWREHRQTNSLWGLTIRPLS